MWRNRVPKVDLPWIITWQLSGADWIELARRATPAGGSGGISSTLYDPQGIPLVSIRLDAVNLTREERETIIGLFEQ